MTPRMHAGQVAIDVALVRRLVDAQFPRWTGLPLFPVRSAGTVNAIYRLGDELAVRLPLVPSSTADLEAELEWLPRLATAGLPLAIPEPVVTGAPVEEFPLVWAVYRWIDGVPVAPGGPVDDADAAARLAGFVRALRSMPVDGVPDGRGVRPLADDDDAVRSTVATLLDPAEAAAAIAVWEAALAAETWDGERVWVHGDLLPVNLLATGGALSAVLDFGAAGSGDGAYDLLPAWCVLSGGARDVFRAELAPDDDAWARARGYALAKGLMAAPYYRETNPAFAALAHRLIDASIAWV
ncbi:aminoglycoside phosphotransferase family protein [Jiangella sp. DSM 45060]|uniref:aminoglycoside phosphotransferase family protein n=1 Tax=Jiangella sp. DSM 45060 TaxID=1798224 RepID=UPI00087BFEDB|nr:aminoglycoside phosphotransferase family protein [Jiangella sp. DSM 45060]SDS62289.1 Predicted kinase, aminoglycoside phosphotransferase (APT) family [Jiangella sp. DSM 45060]